MRDKNNYTENIRIVHTDGSYNCQYNPHQVCDDHSNVGDNGVDTVDLHELIFLRSLKKTTVEDNILLNDDGDDGDENGDGDDDGSDGDAFGLVNVVSQDNLVRLLGLVKEPNSY